MTQKKLIVLADTETPKSHNTNYIRANENFTELYDTIALSKQMNALTGAATPITNMLATPLAMNGAGFANATAGIVLTANRVQFANGNQLGAHTSSNPLLTMVAGHKYIIVVKGKGLTGVSGDKSTLYPSLSVFLGNNGNSVFSVNIDLDVGTNRGNALVFKPYSSKMYSTFFAISNTSDVLVAISDITLQTGDSLVDIEFITMYDITGLSGLLQDAANNIFIDLETVNFIGDSMAHGIAHAATQVLGKTTSNINGQYFISGNLTNGSAVVTGTDTSGLVAGFSVRGNGIPAGCNISTINSPTQFTMTGNATVTIANSQILAGYSGGGKTSTGVASNFADAVARDASLVDNKTIIWTGHNNPANSISLSQAKTDILAIVNSLKNDFRILTCLYNNTWINPRGASADYVDRLNAWMVSYFGAQCIDVRDGILSAHNSSLTDLTAVAWKSTPLSLRADDIHLKDRGKQVVADEIYKHLKGIW